MLKERMPSKTSKSVSKKRKKKREPRQSTETIKLALTGEPKDESHLPKYTTTLYNQVPKQVEEAENYCNIGPKSKKHLTKQCVFYPIIKSP